VNADADGRFLFEQLPAGNFDFSVRKEGYYGGRYGQRHPFSAAQPFELAEGESVSDVELPVWQNATVSGRVVDAAGQPAPGVTVRMLMVGVENGVRRLRAAERGQTDVAGKYLIAGVVPLTYAAAIVSPAIDGYAQGAGANAAVLGYPTTYYPGSGSADAATLMTIAPGEWRRDVDFALPPTPMVSVAGTVAGYAADARQQIVEMWPARPVVPTPNVSVATATIRPDGRFRFPKVPAGSYVLRTVVFATSGPFGQTVSPEGYSWRFVSSAASLPLPPLPPAPTVWASTAVTVADRDLAGITLALRPAGRIVGQVTFTGAAPRPTSEQLLATPVLVRGVRAQELREFPVARIETDGTFTTVGLPPGTYSLAAMTGAIGGMGGRWDAAWRPEATRIAGRNTVGDAIELGDADVTGVSLTFTDSIRPTELSGIVREATGRPRPDATIYVFPVKPELRPGTVRSRELRPGRTGRYSISDLPPLEYFVVATIDDVGELWREQTYLAKLSATASRVTLAAGESKTLDLTVR
jgi:hypothetical protein